MASITVSADGTDQKFPLENGPVTLGRGLESDIRLKDIKASRRHCQILKTPKGYQCVDLSSGNGTFINGIQIKQQMLNPGDKIQIGTTTITFHPGDEAKPPAAAPAKAPTGPMPKAGAATSRSATAKIAVPQAGAPTKRTTQKIETAKPNTQAISKQSTQSLKGPAGAKKTTGRALAAQTTGRTASASQRLRGKKGVNPMVVLGVIVGVIFLLVVGLILFWPKDDSELIRHQLEGLLKKASEAENADKFDEAIRLNKEALGLCMGDRYKGQAAELRKRIVEIESNKLLMAGADKRFEDFKAKVKSATDAQANDLYTEGKKIKEDYSGANVTWMADLGQQLEILQKMLDTKAAMDKRGDFQNRRAEINKKHNMDDKDPLKREYTAAIREWKEFLGGKPAGDQKGKAEGEINNINVRANEAVTLLKKRAERLVGEGNKAAAVEILKKERARFELTASADDLEKAIQAAEK